MLERAGILRASFSGLVYPSRELQFARKGVRGAGLKQNIRLPSVERASEFVQKTFSANLS